MNEFEQFMLEYQTQFVFFTNNIFDFYQESLPEDLKNFEYEYLSLFFKDLSYLISNDYLPNNKTWFTEVWNKSLKQQLLSMDSYLCNECMSISFKKLDGVVEVLDHFKWLQEPEFEIPDDLKTQIDNNYLLQMIKKEKTKGLQSIKCACGNMTALLERVQYVTEDKSIYKLIQVNSKCDESTAESSEDSEEVFEIGDLRDVVLNKIQS